MTNPDPSSPKVVDIEVHGEGTFRLPLCGPEVTLGVGDQIALITFHTTQGQAVGVPVDHQTLSNLYQLLKKALSDMGPVRSDNLQ